MPHIKTEKTGESGGWWIKVIFEDFKIRVSESLDIEVMCICVCLDKILGSDNAKTWANP